MALAPGGAVAVHREGRCVCRSFGSAWLCLQEAAVGALLVVDVVFECGARGCATPLGPARGPVARHGSNSLSTRLDMQLQDTAHSVKTQFKTRCCGSILAAPLLTGFGGQQWGQVLVRTS